MCLQEHSFLQYDSFTLACGIIMAARKMMKLKEKWPQELYNMTGQRKKASQIKRCMNHIFEFYEETFPEQSIKAFDSLSTSAGDDKSAGKSQGHQQPLQQRVQSRPNDFIEITTPTDIETPAKEIIGNKPQNSSVTQQVTGEKTIEPNF